VPILSKARAEAETLEGRDLLPPPLVNVQLPWSAQAAGRGVLKSLVPSPWLTLDSGPNNTRKAWRRPPNFARRDGSATLGAGAERRCSQRANRNPGFLSVLRGM
jgi:hypothetical protein